MLVFRTTGRFEKEFRLAVKREPGIIIFERTGTHADLFE
jgi:mRNA-degrading endonuclease YafQ of YafQ-DinJ toxin-antitoxin module